MPRPSGKSHRFPASLDEKLIQLTGRLPIPKPQRPAVSKNEEEPSSPTGKNEGNEIVKEKTVAEEQAAKIERLFTQFGSNNRILELPEPKKKRRELSPPPEIARSTHGKSMAISKSNELNLFKKIQKKDRLRLEYMRRDAEEEEKMREFEARNEERRIEEEARTAKKRMKRLKRKQQKKKSRADDDSSDGETDDQKGSDSSPEDLISDDRSLKKPSDTASEVEPTKIVTSTAEPIKPKPLNVSIIVEDDDEF